jgi:hypothetical protein
VGFYWEFEEFWVETVKQRGFDYNQTGPLADVRGRAHLANNSHAPVARAVTAGTP